MSVARIQFNRASNRFDVIKHDTVIASYSSYTMALYRIQYENRG